MLEGGIVEQRFGERGRRGGERPRVLRGQPELRGGIGGGSAAPRIGLDTAEAARAIGLGAMEQEGAVLDARRLGPRGASRGWRRTARMRSISAPERFHTEPGRASISSSASAGPSRSFARASGPARSASAPHPAMAGSRTASSLSAR